MESLALGHTLMSHGWVAQVCFGWLIPHQVVTGPTLPFSHLKAVAADIKLEQVNAVTCALIALYDSTV
jgi:hypothetical protein